MLPKVIEIMGYAYKNSGGIMAGFGTWANILEIMIKDHNFFFHYFLKLFF